MYGERCIVKKAGRYWKVFASLRWGFFKSNVMKKLIIALSFPLMLTACSGGQIGLGANSGGGFPGIGLGAGLSLPIGNSDATQSDNDYVNQVTEHVYQNVDGIKKYAGKRCNIQFTADRDGQLIDVKRLSGDNDWCDALMVAAYKFTRIPAPPSSMVERLKNGLVIEFTPH